MKHSYPSISVSQFFEDMVNEGNVRSEANPVTVSDPSMPDLREIPDVDISNLFGAPKAPKKIVAESKESSKDLKQEMLELMVEFKQVVQKANKLFSEMTGTGSGSFGVNMAGPAKKSKDCFKKEETKNGYRPLKTLKRKQR